MHAERATSPLSPGAPGHTINNTCSGCSCDWQCLLLRVVGGAVPLHRSISFMHILVKRFWVDVGLVQARHHTCRIASDASYACAALHLPDQIVSATKGATVTSRNLSLQELLAQAAHYNAHSRKGKHTHILPLHHTCPLLVPQIGSRVSINQFSVTSV